jgi:hypothetical protein
MKPIRTWWFLETFFFGAAVMPIPETGARVAAAAPNAE